jgi:dihydropteroate synthase
MKKTQLMAILNCTPDSFYDGGKYYDPKTAIARGLEMIDEGADIIDIGGESSRPGAAPISASEEIKRILPVILALAGKVPLSIDTSKVEVAKAALEAGASMVNDITGGVDPQMIETVRHFNAKICIMHLQGTPQTMQINPCYPRGVVEEIMDFFKKRIECLCDMGLKVDQIILDPGIGFGKTHLDCLTILNHLSTFRTFNLPVLVGLSRKSFMSKILGRNSTELLSTTVAMNTISILESVEIIRVHDVIEHRDVIDALYHLRKAKCNPILASSSLSSKS